MNKKICEYLLSKDRELVGIGIELFNSQGLGYEDIFKFFEKPTWIVYDTYMSKDYVIIQNSNYPKFNHAGNTYVFNKITYRLNIEANSTYSK